MTHHDTSSKSSQNHHIFPKSSFFPAHLLPPRAPHQQLWLRWRPLAAAEAGLTAARAAGMPVRRPRRPAAASAADAETDLELSCGAVENGAQTLLAAFARRRGDRAGRGDALAHARRRRAARVWVALAAAPQPGHRTPRLSSPRPLLSSRGIFVSGLVCVRRSVCGCVSVCLLAQFLRRGTPLFFPSALSFVLVCARVVMGSAGVVLRLRLCLRLRWVVGWVLLVGAQSRTRARVE